MTMHSQRLVSSHQTGASTFIHAETGPDATGYRDALKRTAPPHYKNTKVLEEKDVPVYTSSYDDDEPLINYRKKSATSKQDKKVLKKLQKEKSEGCQERRIVQKTLKGTLRVKVDVHDPDLLSHSEEESSNEDFQWEENKTSPHPHLCTPKYQAAPQVDPVVILSSERVAEAEAVYHNALQDLSVPLEDLQSLKRQKENVVSIHEALVESVKKGQPRRSQRQRGSPD